jgi:hypothetical protein
VLDRVLDRRAHAAEVDAETERVKAAIAARQEMANRPKPTLTLKLPTEAQKPTATASQIKFTVAVGKGQQVVGEIRDQLVAEGWQETNSMLEEVFGTISLSKEDQSLVIGYIESTILPADITISSTSIELRTP